MYNVVTNSKEFFATFVKKSKPTFNSEYDSADYYIEDLTESETFFILYATEKSEQVILHRNL